MPTMSGREPKSSYCQPNGRIQAIIDGKFSPNALDFSRIIQIFKRPKFVSCSNRYSMSSFLYRKCSRLAVFVSYSRADQAIASEIAQVLRNRGDTIFYDEDSLPPASDFNARIASAISSSDRFIFLISQDSLKPDSFAQEELRLAKKKWPIPVGKVWPVALDPNLKVADVDAYLRSVNILTTDGSLPLNLATEIDSSRRVGALCWAALMSFIFAIALAAVWALWPIIGSPPGNMMSVGSPVVVGHWTGAPTVTVRTTLRNTKRRRLRVDDLRAYVTGPSGKRISLSLEGAVTNGVVLPVPEIAIEPGEKWSGDLAFLAAPADLIDVHQRLYDTFAGTPESLQPWNPNTTVLTGQLLEDVTSLSKKAFVWKEGEWAVEILSKMGEQRATATISFALTDDDVKIMKSVFAYYHTGAGVFSNWRFVGQAAYANRPVDAVIAD